ncbi:MAG: hypothetical protein B6U65_00465 [Candidatus Wolframiiraptor sp. EX4484-121]|nr:MAG: hypothetical protein B6U65_00465 [Candidatus Wolframiiraptor sp. EX4484-121]
MTPGARALKAHIGVCGIGFGHASRSLSIARELKRMGWEISLSSYGDGLEYLRRMGLEVKPVPTVRYGVLPEAKVSIKFTIFRNLLFPIRFAEQTACEMDYLEDAEIVISDSRASTIVAGKLLGKPVLTILNQFNIRVVYPRYRRLIELLEGIAQVVGWIWARSDKILITDYPPPLTISKQNLVIPDGIKDKVEFIGPIIDKRPEDLPSREEIEAKYRLSGGRPRIFFHATGPSYERRKLIEELLPMLGGLADRYEIIASLGGMNPGASIPEGIKVFKWVDEPLELFKVSDLVICRPGQTTLAKALTYGKPVLMIPISAHGEQLGNASSVAELGAGLILKQEELKPELLERMIEELLSNESYRINAERYANSSSSLNPLNRVVEAAEELLEEAR